MQLVVYDIEDDGARGRVASLLKGYGRRVQKSVFECHLGAADLEEMLERVGRELERARGGQVRVYQVCARCLQASYGLGEIEASGEPTCYIV